MIIHCNNWPFYQSKSQFHIFISDPQERDHRKQMTQAEFRPFKLCRRRLRGQTLSCRHPLQVSNISKPAGGTADQPGAMSGKNQDKNIWYRTRGGPCTECLNTDSYGGESRIPPVSPACTRQGCPGWGYVSRRTRPGNPGQKGKPGPLSLCGKEGAISQTREPHRSYSSAFSTLTRTTSPGFTLLTPFR